MPALPPDTSQIVITASRAPEDKTKTPASVTIIDSKKIARLGEPLIASLLRLTPSAAVSTSGPAGSFTEVRIRGAENNHTLLFIDGIRANDPATGDFARFELLNADLASRIEVVRGPQSALWGSDAIGGVVAVNGVDDATGTSGSVEGGSYGFARAGASTAMSGTHASLAGAVGWQRATGIDSFGAAGGDKDGYRNISGRFRATWHPADAVELGASAFTLTGTTEFDGYDVNPPYHHSDTLDSSRDTLSAGRLWARFGDAGSLSGEVSASLLGSANRNYLAHNQINRTQGSRRTLAAQIQQRFATGAVSHTVIAAAEDEREGFHARDTVYGGFSDQDRNRDHRSLTAEWRAELHGTTADVALRHDMFNRFKDATTARASLQTALGRGFALAGSYGEGIAQPTFFDLYGAFPAIFRGNPSLRPESSRGYEISLRYLKGALSASLTGYRQTLHDEIVDTYDPLAFLYSAANRTDLSHRSGIEAELSWIASKKLRFSANYAFLDAKEPGDIAGLEVKELRRPRHSGSISVDGVLRRFSYGASLSYVGTHFDKNYDVYPAQGVRLHGYWLADARIEFPVSSGLAVFVRGANLLNQHYEDAFGYRTEGRGLFAGVRLADRRSSP